MKYDLKPADNTKIAHSEKYDAILKFIKHKENFKFNVGDVLVKNVITGYGDERRWEPEQVSHISTASKKFLYFYENEDGIGFIKSILSTGKIGEAVTPMTEFDPDNIKFELDPDYAEHIILSDENEEFNAAARHEHKKKFREKAYRANKKLLASTYNNGDRLAFLHTLKVGDKLWMGHDMDQMVESQYEVLSMAVAPNSDRWHRERFEKWKKENGITLEHITITVKQLTSKYPNNIGSTQHIAYDSYNRFMTIKTPYPMTEDCK